MVVGRGSVHPFQNKEIATGKRHPRKDPILLSSRAKRGDLLSLFFCYNLLKMKKQFYVYILSNKYNNVLYIGVTNDLKRRVYEHKSKLIDGFTKKYNVNKLVYYEIFEDAYNAISREKQLKAGSRKDKIDLINKMNKEWKDLYEEI